MFGYIQAFRPELKGKDQDLYKATYCGLCSTLRQRYGLIAPLFLNYDLTFLALLLEEPQDCYHPTKKRCHGNPLCKKSCVPSSEALYRCADMTMILAWFKIKDTLADEGFGKRVMAQMLSCFLRPSFLKAKQYLPDFYQSTKDNLSRLAALEGSCCDSMDQVADCFATILCQAVPSHLPSSQKRPLEQILYHVGRWIYLMDACDDFESDKKNAAYNPLRYRYGAEIDCESLALTLNHSIYMATSALDFLDFGVRTGVIENMFQYGLPVVQKAVMDDQWQEMKKQRRYRQ